MSKLLADARVAFLSALAISPGELMFLWVLATSPRLFTAIEARVGGEAWLLRVRGRCSAFSRFLALFFGRLMEKKMIIRKGDETMPVRQFQMNKLVRR